MSHSVFSSSTAATTSHLDRTFNFSRVGTFPDLLLSCSSEKRSTPLLRGKTLNFIPSASSYQASFMRHSMTATQASSTNNLVCDIPTISSDSTFDYESWPSHLNDCVERRDRPADHYFQYSVTSASTFKTSTEASQLYASTSLGLVHAEEVMRCYNRAMESYNAIRALLMVLGGKDQSDTNSKTQLHAGNAECHFDDNQQNLFSGPTIQKESDVEKRMNNPLYFKSHKLLCDPSETMFESRKESLSSSSATGVPETKSSSIPFLSPLSSLSRTKIQQVPNHSSNILISTNLAKEHNGTPEKTDIYEPSSHSFEMVHGGSCPSWNPRITNSVTSPLRQQFIHMSGKNTYLKSTALPSPDIKLSPATTATSSTALSSGAFDQDYQSMSSAAGSSFDLTRNNSSLGLVMSNLNISSHDHPQTVILPQPHVFESPILSPNLPIITPVGLKDVSDESEKSYSSDCSAYCRRPIRHCMSALALCQQTSTTSQANSQELTKYYSSPSLLLKYASPASGQNIVNCYDDTIISLIDNRAELLPSLLTRARICNKNKAQYASSKSNHGLMASELESCHLSITRGRSAVPSAKTIQNVNSSMNSTTRQETKSVFQENILTFPKYHSEANTLPSGISGCQNTCIVDDDKAFSSSLIIQHRWVKLDSHHKLRPSISESDLSRLADISENHRFCNTLSTQLFLGQYRKNSFLWKKCLFSEDLRRRRHMIYTALSPRQSPSATAVLLNASSPPTNSNSVVRPSQFDILRAMWVDTAAITIQRYWRGYVSRKQAIFSSYFNFWKLRAAQKCRIIERAFKNYIRRCKQEELRVLNSIILKRQSAAMKIQEFWRRRMLYYKDQFEQLVDTLMRVRNAAALEIQRVYRGFKTRQHLNSLIKYRSYSPVNSYLLNYRDPVGSVVYSSLTGTSSLKSFKSTPCYCSISLNGNKRSSPNLSKQVHFCRFNNPSDCLHDMENHRTLYGLVQPALHQWRSMHFETRCSPKTKFKDGKSNNLESSRCPALCRSSARVLDQNSLTSWSESSDFDEQLSESDNHGDSENYSEKNSFMSLKKYESSPSTSRRSLRNNSNALSKAFCKPRNIFFPTVAQNPHEGKFSKTSPPLLSGTPCIHLQSVAGKSFSLTCQWCSLIQHRHNNGPSCPVETCACPIPRKSSQRAEFVEPAPILINQPRWSCSVPKESSMSYTQFDQVLNPVPRLL